MEKKINDITIRVTEILRLKPYQLDGTLLLGLPGIGKTAIIYQYAKRQAEKEGRKFLDVREASINELRRAYENPEEYYVYMRIIAPHMFPEDVSIPRLYADYVLHLAPLALTVFGRRGIQGLLFVDELTNVQRADQQALYFSLLQERELGWSVRISDCVTIVAAGNPPEYSSAAGGLPAPVTNRLLVLHVAPPTPLEWGDYMERKYGDRWDPRIAAFLAANPEIMAKPPADPETLQPFPTPRSWTKLALRTLNIPDDSLLFYVMASGLVGPEAAQKLEAFLKIKVPPVPEFLSKPSDYWDSFNISQKWLMIYYLSQRPREVVGAAGRLREIFSKNKEFLVLLIKTTKYPEKLRVAATFEDLVREVARELKDYYSSSSS